MSDSKFTPGPWHIGIPGPNGRCTIGTVRGLMTAMIAHSINEPDQVVEAKANAKLIAAAPCLLSLAQRWLALDSQWHPERHANEKAELLVETRDLIAKATA